MTEIDRRQAFEAVLRVLRRTLVSLADEVREIEGGIAVSTPSLPLVWSLNQLRLSEPVDLETVVAAADALQGELGFRHVVIEDDVAAAALADRLRRAGWGSERIVHLVLAAEADKRVDTGRVVELDPRHTEALMRRWTLEEHPTVSPAGLEQLVEYARREGALFDERCFGVLSDAGEPEAVTKLRVAQDVAWVEDVYTVPEARGRGHARALVSYATQRAREADRELTFIIADAADWPQRLYEKVGFRPVGHGVALHRQLDRADF